MQVVFDEHRLHPIRIILQSTQVPKLIARLLLIQLVQTDVEEHVVQLGIRVQSKQADPDRAYPEKQLLQVVLDEHKLHPGRTKLQSTQAPASRAKLVLMQAVQVELEEQVVQLGMRVLQRSHVPPFRKKLPLMQVLQLRVEEQLAQYGMVLLQGLQVVPARAYPGRH